MKRPVGRPDKGKRVYFAIRTPESIALEINELVERFDSDGNAVLNDLVVRGLKALKEEEARDVAA